MNKIVYQIVDTQLQTGDYDDKLADKWSNQICEDCIEALVKLHKPFKYIGMYIFDLLTF